MSDAHQAILAVEKMTKKYGSRVIIEDLSFQLDFPGRIYGILGPNGAGKTTLFRCVMGLVRFGSGRIEVEGKDVTKLPCEERVRHGIAYMFQESVLFHDLSVSENLQIVAEQVFSRKNMPGIDGILDRYGLLAVKKNRASTLSGGEKKRLEFARCMLLEPRLFLLDEPFSNIDPIMVADMKTLIREHTRKGITFLVTDHNLHEILPFVDYVFVLYGGKFIARGTRQEIVSDPRVRGLYLGNYAAPETSSQS